MLARTHRSTTVNQTRHRDLQLLDQGGLRRQIDRARPRPRRSRWTGATLAYRDDVEHVTASAPDKALLIPDIVYTGSHDGGPYGVDTALLTFTPTGGAAIPAKNISTDADQDPQRVRGAGRRHDAARITVGGTATETFSGEHRHLHVTVATPMSFPIDFPAG